MPLTTPSPLRPWAIALLLLLGPFSVALADTPWARDGLLDLSELSFDDETDIRLRGDWAFYWMALLTPQALQTGVGERRLQLAPSRWNYYAYNDNDPRGHAHATFHLKLLLPAAAPAMTLVMPELNGAYRLWINGVQVAELGRVGTDSASEQPSAKTLDLPLPIGSREVELLLQLSNYHFYSGGLNRLPRIATTDAIVAERARHTLYHQVTLGLTLLLLGYALARGMVGGEVTRYRLLALISAAVVANGIAVARVPLFGLPELPFQLQERVEFSTLLLLPGLLLTYLYRLLPRDYCPFIAGQMLLFVVTLVLVVLVTPLSFHTQISNGFQLVLLFTFAYVVVVGLRAAYRRRRGGLAVGLSGGILALALLVQFLDPIPQLSVYALLPPALLLFFLSHIALPKGAAALEEAPVVGTISEPVVLVPAEPTVAPTPEVTSVTGGEPLGTMSGLDGLGGDGGREAAPSTPLDIDTLRATTLAQAQPNKVDAGHTGPVVPGEFAYRILLIDEDPVSRIQLVDRLRAEGMQVELANTGREAYERLLRGDVDLLVSDLHAHGMSAIEITKRLRNQQIPLVAATPVIILNGDVSLEVKGEVADASADQLLAKPVDESRLIDEVRRLLAHCEPRAISCPASPVVTDDADIERFNKLRLLDEGLLTARLAELGKEEMKHFFAIFRRTGDERMAAIHAAQRSVDHTAMDEEVHTFKGAAATLGLNALEALCQELERRLKARHLADLDDWVEALSGLYDRTLLALDTFTAVHIDPPKRSSRRRKP